MLRNDCDKVVAAIFAEPWAILPAALDQIIAIASRSQSDVAHAAAVREARAERLEATRRKAAVVIPVHGPIFPRASLFGESSGATNVADMNRMLAWALASDEVGSIVLDIDSPGGYTTGIHEFAERVRAASSQKPVVAYVSGMAASAAYWIAAAASRIVADPTTTVGSIGTVYAWTDDTTARKRAGLKDYHIVSSQSPNKWRDPNSPEERSEIQERADYLADIFIGKVAEYRNVTADYVAENFGQGGIMLAEMGLRVGMVDEIGSMETALESASSGLLVGHSHMEGKNMELLGTGAAAAGKNDNPKGKAEGDEDDEDENTPASAAEQHDDEEDDEETAAAEADDAPADDEEDTEEKKQESAKQKKAKAENPGVYNTAFKAGIAAERARLREIRALGLVGQKALVERAMFTAPMSAGTLAIAYAKAEKNARSAMGAARLVESATANVPLTPVNAGAKAGTAAEEARAIAVMAGKTA